MALAPALILLFLVTFLLGSVPWGLVISRVVFHKDIRKEGSGNIGTTNAMRSLGKAGGASVFVLDFGKGVLSGFLATVCSTYVLVDATDALAGICLAISFMGCTLGHIYSPWLKFHGGKGIAVAVGALFFMYGIPGAVIELGLFAILVIVTRYVSVGSIAAALLCPFLSLYFYSGNWVAIAIITFTALNVVFAHRENISRLLNHCENKIGSKKEKAS